VASKHAMRALRRGEESSSSWLIKKSWGTIQRGWRSVYEGGLGDACMKAVLTQYLCVQAGERKVRGVLVRGRDALHNWNAIARITQ